MNQASKTNHNNIIILTYLIEAAYREQLELGRFINAVLFLVFCPMLRDSSLGMKVMNLSDSSVDRKSPAVLLRRLRSWHHQQER